MAASSVISDCKFTVLKKVSRDRILITGQWDTVTVAINATVVSGAFRRDGR